MLDRCGFRVDLGYGVATDTVTDDDALSILGIADLAANVFC